MTTKKQTTNRPGPGSTSGPAPSPAANPGSASPTRDFAIDPETLALLRTLDETSGVDADNRSALAIDALAATKSRDAGRILIETFERCMWRATKITITRALGPMQLSRTTEFLINQARDPADLVLAAEAMLSLGASDDPLAGEFLLQILKINEHPLHREALIALSQMSLFPCERELLDLLGQANRGAHVTDAVLQYVILALGRCGHATAWEAIETAVEKRKHQTVLVNAAIITAGMIGGARADTWLSTLDTRYRFFAQHLKQLARERIHLRLRRGVEDAIQAILTASNPSELSQVIGFIREFKTSEAWEAFQLLGQGAPATTKIWVRLVLFDPSRLNEDLEFISEHWKDIDWNPAASLLRLHRDTKGESKNKNESHQQIHQSIHLWLEKQERDRQCAILSRVVLPQAAQLLSKHILASNVETATKIKCVNALVAQALVHSPATSASPKTNDICAALGDLEKKVEKSPQNEALRDRIIRALGQVHFNEPAFFISLAAQLKEEDPARVSSIYAALSNTNEAEAFRVICRRLRKIANTVPLPVEGRIALSALAAFTYSSEIETKEEEIPLIADKDAFDTTLLRSLLQILSRRPAPGYESHILAGLGSSEHFTKILAVAAAKPVVSSASADNSTAVPTIAAINKAVWDTLNSPVQSLSGRAFDTLSASSDVESHRRLWKWLIQGERDAELVHKFSRCARTSKGSPQQHTLFLAELNDVSVKNWPTLTDTDVNQSLSDLKSHLQIIAKSGTAQSRQNAAPQASQSSNASKKAHGLDEELSQQITVFPQFSEVIKTVLRNAELTFKHTDLFDDRVDKSTMIVEFVKSIDLLLQERLGSLIFGDRKDLLVKMQSRIIQLQLDDDAVSNANLIRDLQCGMQFAADNFPGHKLVGLCRTIASGKIARDQYAAIDGLRAWAIILLLFARKFKCRQTPIEPLFTIADSTNGAICEVAARMNQMQEMRNLAAHRGTMLVAARLEEVRKYSFELLNELTRILGH